MMNTLAVIRRKTAVAAVPAWIDLRVMAILGCFAAAAVMADESGPTWWGSQSLTKTGTGVTVADYALANQGQLKNMARAACDELIAKGYIDTSHAIYQRVLSWRTNTANAKDYAPLNLGQLKAVAKPIYDVLKARDSSINYPWSSAATDDKDYAMANIGQLKHVFNFAIPDLLQAAANLNTSQIMPRSVTLTWQDTNTLEDGYRIERSPDNSTFAPLTTLGANTTTYTDSGSGVSRNTDYYYRVKAFRGSTVAPASNVAHAKTQKDTDDDGIPDDWEIARGMNPNNSSDAGLSLNLGGPTALENYVRSVQNPNLGQLTITITSPGSGSTL